MTLRGFPLTQAGHYRRLKARRFASQWNINAVPRVLSSPYAHSGYSWLNVSTRSPNVSVLETRAFLNWPLLSSSLSLSLCTRCPALFLFVQREQRYRTGEKESFLRIFACTDRSRWKRTDEHRFSPAGSAFASKRLTSATLQTRPIYTTIDREKPVNRKLVKFDP